MQFLVMHLSADFRQTIQGLLPFGSTSTVISGPMPPADDDDDKNHRSRRGPSAVAPGCGRRKFSTSRSWLVVSDDGRSSVEEIGKHLIMQRTGLPARDLRVLVLDPLLSYPSTIRGREKSIVINLEHIKAIITANEVLIPNFKDPIVAPFIKDLQVRVCTKEVARSGSSQELEVPKDAKLKVLPFEFRALEVCLVSACKCLEDEIPTLEDVAYPVLDELTSKISTLNLERVRQIKSRLVSVSRRVRKVKDELEHLLNDDGDMAEMYLSEKLNQSVGVSSDKVDPRNYTFQIEEERDEGHEDDDSDSGRRSLGCVKPNIEELEMLLESYFAQIDSTLNKLSTLREYVDDTEDYINIILDRKQNQLLQMGVMLSTATLLLSAGIAITGVFGTNFQFHLRHITDLSVFWKITSSIVGGCILLYFVAIWWGNRSGLLQ